MNPLLEVLCNEINKIKKMLTTTGTDYTATVTRVDGNTAYVQMAGSEISDTPVSMTINANVGDKVRVRVSNGRAWITGNDTAPPADNKQVIEMIENNSQGLIETEAKYSRIDQTIDQITIEVGEVDTKADNAQATADGRMKSDMSNKASSITVNSGQIAFNSNSLVVNSSKFTLDQNGNATFGGVVSVENSEGVVTISPALSVPLLIEKTIDSQTKDIVKLSPLGGLVVARYLNNVEKTNIHIQRSQISMMDDGYSNRTNIKVDYVYVTNGSSSATLTHSGVQTSSDIRLKEDITMIDPDTAKHLMPVQFRFKGNDKLHYGFIAQDVQKIMPDAVQESEDGYLTLTYHELIAPLYALVQEQEDRISRLEARIEQLEKGE